MDLQSAGILGSLVLSGAGIIFSLIALVVSLHDSRSDRINLNSWETYRAYNSEEVRHGRSLSLKVLRDTAGRGFESYSDYAEYFGILPTSLTHATAFASAVPSQERQYLHDLAAFYHQTGVLLTKNRLDRDFTLLLVGPGLEDRWNVYRQFAYFYESESKGEGDLGLPYGGIYLLFDAYAKWKRKRFKSLMRMLTQALERSREQVMD